VGTTAAVVGTEAAVGTTAAVVGTEAAVGTTAAVVGTEAAAGTTAATGLTAAQATGLGTAATTVATAAQTPAGQEVLQSIEENLPALENEAQVVAQEVQAVLPQIQSVAPQAQAAADVAVQETSPAAQGVATVLSHEGSHVSILVEHGQEALHTEQVVLNGNLTTIAEVRNAAPVLQSVQIPLPNASAAIQYQQSVIDTATGLYNRSCNSCVTHVGDVLREGGVEDVPERTLDIIRWLRNQ
jgi:hypothetical protein